MKPTNQQKQWLQNYLQSVLKYRETCIEVYDHLLAALEEKPETRFFETNVIEIIESDFGGNNGLLKLEENFEAYFGKQIALNYSSIFMKKWLGVPGFAYFGLIALCLYQSMDFYNFHFVAVKRLLLFTPVVCWAIPIVTYWIGSIKTSKLFERNKFSAKRNALNKIIFRPVKFFLFYTFYAGTCFYFIIRFFRNSSFNLNYGVACLMHFFSVFIFVLSIIHVFAFYKIYSREFKMSKLLDNLSHQ